MKQYISPDTINDAYLGVTAVTALYHNTTEIYSALEYSPEAIALFTRMDVQPDAERKILIDTFIKTLKTGGVWNKADVLFLYASHTSQASLLNLKGDLHNGIAVNSPTFIQNSGWYGQSIVKYISIDFNPSLGSCSFVRNNCMALVYNYYDAAATNYYIINTTGIVVGCCRMYNNGSQNYGAITPSVATMAGDGNNSDAGFKWIRRNVSTHMQFGTNLNPNPLTNRLSAEIPSYTFLATAGVVRQGLIYLGAYLDDTENAVLQGAVLTYLTAIGAI